MSDLAQFRVAPPLRCFGITGSSELDICGAPARWVRPGVTAVPLGYFCDRCRELGDTPIAAPFVLQRVSLTTETLFAAACWEPARARAEALEQLLRAVEGAGGLLNFHQASAAVGRFSPPPARQAGPGRPRRA